MTKEIREGTLHDFKLEGQYCVTFREIAGDTVTLSFSCYPTRSKALRAISLFKYDVAWGKLASV